MYDILICLLIVVLVVHSAIFSASEIASAKSNKIRIHKAAENGDRTAKVIEYINTNYSRFLSTVLAGNNFVNIGASSAMTMLMVAHFGASKGPTLASIITTVILLIFGETLPKILAAAVPDKAMRLFSWPLRIYMTVLFPIVWVVTKFMDLLAPLWTPKNAEPTVTTEELCEILDDIEEEGVFTENETELIRSAIEFTEIAAYEILTPRVNVVAIDIEDLDVHNCMELAGGHSRVPVYKDTIDNIIGILPIKHLLREMVEKGSVNLDDILLPPLYVHETCPVSTIISEFRVRHDKLAIVVDEFGGMAGIVTLEDILEEIVGEIYTGESLGVTADVLEQAANGEAVVADCDLAYLANYVPDMAAVMSPYLIQEPEDMNKLWPSDVFQDLCSQLEAKGLHLIALNYEGSRSLWTKTPITCRDDVGKLKIRCASTTMWNSVVETLGGNPTNIPMSEVYQAVSQGVVDGCEGVFSVIYSNKVYEVLKYCTLTEHLVGYTAIVMSSEIYNNLSPEAQAALDQTAADYMNEFMELSGGVQDEYRAKLEAEGVTVNTIDKAEFIEASANVPKNFPEWTPGILDELKAVLE